MEVVVVSKQVHSYLMFPYLKHMEKYCTNKIDKFDKNR